MLQWLHSFLAERTQTVRYRADTSPPADVTCGVPQGSVLGPLLFILFTADLIGLVNDHGLSILMYADDIQLYGSCNPSKKRELSEQVSSCLDSLICWFRNNRLLLNTDKSEFMWFASRQRWKSFSSDQVRIGDQLLTPVTSARCLGVYLDSDATFSTHITKTVSSCFSVLRQIRSVRRSLNRPLLTTLVSALVLTRLDYCISILQGTSSAQLKRLQALLNASARLIFGCSRFSSATALLKALHWLPIRERIERRLATITHSCIKGIAPDYLSSELNRVSGHAGRARLRSALTSSLLVPRVRRPTIGSRSFAFAAPKLWNSLPSSIIEVEDLKTFKVLLYKHLLSRSSP